jgi:hypothetical protein
VVVSRATMGRVLQHLNWPRKKKRSMRQRLTPHGCNRPDVTIGSSCETFPPKI